MPPMTWNFGDLLDGLGEVLPADAPALVHGEDRLDWGELTRRSNDLAAALVARGARPDDKVAFYLRNRTEYLVVLAVLTAWSDGSRMTDAFDKAKRLSQSMFAQVAIQTFQGMMRALVTWTEQLLPLLWSRLQQLMRQAGGEFYRIGKWLPLAVDGSRFTTPRTGASTTCT